MYLRRVQKLTLPRLQDLAKRQWGVEHRGDQLADDRASVRIHSAIAEWVRYRIVGSSSLRRGRAHARTGMIGSGNRGIGLRRSWRARPGRCCRIGARGRCGRLPIRRGRHPRHRVLAGLAYPAEGDPGSSKRPAHRRGGDGEGRHPGHHGCPDAARPRGRPRPPRRTTSGDGGGVTETSFTSPPSMPSLK